MSNPRKPKNSQNIPPPALALPSVNFPPAPPLTFTYHPYPLIHPTYANILLEQYFQSNLAQLTSQAKTDLDDWQRNFRDALQNKDEEEVNRILLHNTDFLPYFYGMDFVNEFGVFKIKPEDLSVNFELALDYPHPNLILTILENNWTILIDNIKLWSRIRQINLLNIVLQSGHTKGKNFIEKYINTVDDRIVLYTCSPHTTETLKKLLKKRGDELFYSYSAPKTITSLPNATLDTHKRAAEEENKIELPQKKFANSSHNIVIKSLTKKHKPMTTTDKTIAPQSTSKIEIKTCLDDFLKSLNTEEDIQYKTLWNTKKAQLEAYISTLSTGDQLRILKSVANADRYESYKQFLLVFIPIIKNQEVLRLYLLDEKRPAVCNLVNERLLSLKNESFSLSHIKLPSPSTTPLEHGQPDGRDSPITLPSLGSLKSSRR